MDGVGAAVMALQIDVNCYKFTYTHLFLFWGAGVGLRLDRNSKNTRLVKKMELGPGCHEAWEIYLPGARTSDRDARVT